MFHKRVICCWLTLFLLAQPVFADIIVLKSGNKYVGTLANREEIRSKTRVNQTIAILIDSSGELRRFPVKDIEYLVLQDQDHEQVIDLLSMPRDGSSSAPARGSAGQVGGPGAGKLLFSD